MTLYRLKKDVSGYLSVEVFGPSKPDVIEQFAAWARAKCRRSGGTWAAKEVAEVISGDYIEEVVSGVTVDGEPTPVTIRPNDLDKIFEDDEMGAGYYRSLYQPRPIDPGIVEAALLQAGKDPGDYGFTPAAEIAREVGEQDE